MPHCTHSACVTRIDQRLAKKVDRYGYESALFDKTYCHLCTVHPRGKCSLHYILVYHLIITFTFIIFVHCGFHHFCLGSL